MLRTPKWVQRCLMALALLVAAFVVFVLFLFCVDPLGWDGKTMPTGPTPFELWVNQQSHSR